MCLLTNERYKTYQTGFSFGRLGHAPGVGLGGTGGGGGGVNVDKRSNIFKSQSQSQFQRFLNQTLCVFSQMKDIKLIRQDFHSVAWVVMPQGWDLGVPWGVGSPKLFPQNLTRFGV